MSALPYRIFEPDLAPFEPLPPTEVAPIPSDKLTYVQEVIDHYLDDLRARVNASDYTEYSLDRMIFELKRFCVMFGKQPLSQCKQNDLTRWFNAHPEWKAAETKKKISNSIVGCFQWAFDEELIERCPYRKPKFLRRQKSKSRRPASANEYVMLMRFGSRVLRRALFILRRTGLRPKEMRELIWAEIHLDEEVAYIHLEKNKTFHSTGKERKIGLDRATANFLRALKRNQKPKGERDRVFTNKRGTAWDRHTFARHLRRYAKRLGLDKGVAERVSSYCMRHKYVADGIKGSVTTRRIADQVGHQTTQMIDTKYGTSTREEEEHLSEVATEILQRRKRAKSKPKVATPQRDRWKQGSLFAD